MRFVQPSPVVGHHVVHRLILGIPRVTQKAESTGHHSAEGPVVRLAIEAETQCHYDKPGHIVDAVATDPVGHDAIGVLQNPDVVDKGQQVFRSDRRRRCHPPWCEPALQRGAKAPRAQEHIDSHGADGRPGQPRPDTSCLQCGRSELARIVQELEYSLGECCGIVEGHQSACTGGKQVLCVEVRRRYHGAARHHRERQRP